MIFVSFIFGFNCRNRRHTVWQSRPFYFTFLLFLCVGITPTAKLCMHVHTKFNKACSILHYLERGRERVYINNVMSISYNFHQPCCHSLKPVCLIVCPNTYFQSVFLFTLVLCVKLLFLFFKRKLQRVNFISLQKIRKRVSCERGNTLSLMHNQFSKLA